MDDSDLSQALERAERALGRIERSLAARNHETKDSEQQLRSKVREAVAELDELIRASEMQDG
jgi:sugar-specific transcriptional regulator TrmB